MWLLLLEAGMALFILIFIVWWTMFSGRRPENKPRIEEQPDSTVSAEEKSLLFGPLYAPSPFDNGLNPDIATDVDPEDGLR